MDGNNGNPVWPNAAVRPNFFLGVPQPLSVLEMVAAWFGIDVRTLPRETDTTVGTSSVRIDAYPRQRMGIIISNTGANSMVFGWSSSMVYPNGILLQAGFAFQLTWQDDMELLLHGINAISTGSGTTCHVVENVLAGA